MLRLSSFYLSDTEARADSRSFSSTLSGRASDAYSSSVFDPNYDSDDPEHGVLSVSLRSNSRHSHPTRWSWRRLPIPGSALRRSIHGRPRNACLDIASLGARHPLRRSHTRNEPVLLLSIPFSVHHRGQCSASCPASPSNSPPRISSSRNFLSSPSAALWFEYCLMSRSFPTRWTLGLLPSRSTS